MKQTLMGEERAIPLITAIKGMLWIPLDMLVLVHRRICCFVGNLAICPFVDAADPARKFG